MNKKELIDAVATDLATSKLQAENSVNSVLNAIKKGLTSDNQVQLVGFGTFVVRDRKARTGRNPQTGQEIKIQASRTVGFKAGKELKEAL